MAIMSYDTACDVVRQYNELRSVFDVALDMGLDRAECFALVDWLWKKANVREKDIDITSRRKKCVIPGLTEDLWSEYLFVNKLPIRAAAQSLGWTRSRLVDRWEHLECIFRGRDSRELTGKKKLGRPSKQKTRPEPEALELQE